MPRILQSLKLQITAAIALLTLLFVSSTLYSLHVIDLQHSDDILVQLAGRLQFNQQHLTVQAMRYQENAPRDYPSYFRDLRLYFEDLKKTRTEINRIIGAFAANRFDEALTGESMRTPPRLPRRSQAAAQDLARTWQAFLDGMDERMGPDLQEPRLEWAAEWIVTQNSTLEEISRRLSSTLEQDVRARAAEANLVNRLLLTAALVVAVGIATWFYRRVLNPLTIAVEAFSQVANGDFSYRVPVSHDNEIGWLANSFNHLSGRMDALRKLLTRLEQGDDLEGTLRTLSETLPPLIPVDWIGVLVVGPDGRIHLEQAFSDGKPDPIGQWSFEPDKTLLAECIANRDPLHIPDVREMGTLSDSYVFLRRLADLGRRDAIFLPIGSPSTVQGVAVFASRFPHNYRRDHLALLRNLGVLVGVSLGRTIKLVENTRLANIGQFASGIVHEIRNPLATIGLALEHVRGLDHLPDNAHKRIELAGAEVQRLERLLAEILLYAKPLTLDRTALDLGGLVAETIGSLEQESTLVEFQTSPCPPVMADRDRIRQVVINLLTNARQASPPDLPVHVRCQPAGDAWVELEVRNGGEPIPEKTMARVFEPFFTSKRAGTGLGLPIVQRIVSAHGGDIRLSSDDQTGTRVLVHLPVDRAGQKAVDG